MQFLTIFLTNLKRVSELIFFFICGKIGFLKYLLNSKMDYSDIQNFWEGEDEPGGYDVHQMDFMYEPGDLVNEADDFFGLDEPENEEDNLDILDVAEPVDNELNEELSLHGSNELGPEDDFNISGDDVSEVDGLDALDVPEPEDYVNEELGLGDFNELDSDDDLDDIDIIGDEDLDIEVGEMNVTNDSSSSESDDDEAVQHNGKKSIYNFKPLCLIKCYSSNSKYDKKKALPVARSGHRVIASESHLYSLGGYNPKSAARAARFGRCLLFQELWSFNFATHRWKLIISPENIAGMPTELASTALAIYNNVLISHGGTGYPFGEACSNDCYVFTTNEENAIVKKLNVTGELPTAQYGPGIVIHDDYLYTIGGTTGFNYSCDIYRLNLKTKEWENVYLCRPELRDDPEGRYRHEVVYDGEFIYVLGGGTTNSVYDLQRIPAFNLKKNNWAYFNTHPDETVRSEEIANPNDLPDGAGYPKPRKCFSCVQHTLPNGDIEAFITGGLQHSMNDEGDTNTYFDDVWKLNLRTKQWTLIRTAKFPRPLYFHSAAHAGNSCMYIFGGIQYTTTDIKRRKALYKMWMTVPKLSEMCWDAVTFYSNLHYFNRSSLLKAGIPRKFIDRLPSSTATDISKSRIRSHKS